MAYFGGQLVLLELLQLGSHTRRLMVEIKFSFKTIFRREHSVVTATLLGFVFIPIIFQNEL